jgi:hypothetical protein
VLRTQPTAFCDIARGLEITAIVLFAFSFATASVFVLKGVILAGFMFLIASFSPFVYSAFGLLPYRHLFLFFILFLLSIPIVMRYADLLKNPSTKNVITYRKLKESMELLV